MRSDELGDIRICRCSLCISNHSAAWCQHCSKGDGRLEAVNGKQFFEGLPSLGLHISNGNVTAILLYSATASDNDYNCDDDDDADDTCSLL